MKKFLYAAAAIFGIYGSSEAMMKGSPQISYHSTRGEFVERRLADVDEMTFQDMSPDSFDQISHLLQCYQQFVSNSIRKSSPLGKPKVVDPFSELRSSIISTETQFLTGTKKGLDFLLAGYSKLSSPLDETALIKLDSNLIAIYANSSNAGLCRNLAETYKELAESSGIKDDFIRAAFWFRMLYASGEHSSYLSEYKNMLLKAGLQCQI